MTLAEIEAGLDPEVLAQLRALPIVPGRPLLAVDADEVLVYLAEHLARYLPTIGFRMRLTQYQLEGSIFPADCEIPVPFDHCLRLIDRFFDDETLNQQALPGAVGALARKSAGPAPVAARNRPTSSASPAIQTNACTASASAWGRAIGSGLIASPIESSSVNNLGTLGRVWKESVNAFRGR